jgi:hypothetical protein
MDYDKFKKEYLDFETWHGDMFVGQGIKGGESNDVIDFRNGVIDFNDRVVRGPFGISDSVNSPPHYTRGKVEAIEVIEDAIQDAPAPKEGMLQGQVLKYLMRLWLKDNPVEDAKKARWYLDRLISSLES